MGIRPHRDQGAELEETSGSLTLPVASLLRLFLGPELEQNPDAVWVSTGWGIHRKW